VKQLTRTVYLTAVGAGTTGSTELVVPVPSVLMQIQLTASAIDTNLAGVNEFARVAVNYPPGSPGTSSSQVDNVLGVISFAYSVLTSGAAGFHQALVIPQRLELDQNERLAVWAYTSFATSSVFVWMTAYFLPLPPGRRPGSGAVSI